MRYRYGFNGKENDKDINSGGVAFEARIYDSRIGRFFSTDPKEGEYPWQSTYVYFKNSPTSIIDILGMGGPGDDVRITNGPTPIQNALMCMHVYNEKHKVVALEGGWKVSSTVLTIQLSNSATGFNSQLYERELSDGSKQYNYVFAGTDDKPDISQNGKQIIGNSEQYEQAINNSKELANTLKGDLFFAGHSLGGGLATVASLVTGKYATTFNPAWMSTVTALKFNILNTEAAQTNYVVKGELLDMVQKKATKAIKDKLPAVVLIHQRGEKRYIKPSTSLLEKVIPAWGGIRLHKMEAVLKTLEENKFKHSTPTSSTIDASEKVNNPTTTTTG